MDVWACSCVVICVCVCVWVCVKKIVKQKQNSETFVQLIASIHLSKNSHHSHTHTHQHPMCHSIHTFAPLFIRKRIGKIALLIYDNRFCTEQHPRNPLKNQFNRTKSSAILFVNILIRSLSVILAIFFSHIAETYFFIFWIDLFFSCFHTKSQCSH